MTTFGHEIADHRQASFGVLSLINNTHQMPVTGGDKSDEVRNAIWFTDTEALSIWEADTTSKQKSIQVFSQVSG